MNKPKFTIENFVKMCQVYGVMTEEDAEKWVSQNRAKIKLNFENEYDVYQRNKTIDEILADIQ